MGKPIAVEIKRPLCQPSLLNVWGESSEEPHELDESGRCQLCACTS